MFDQKMLEIGYSQSTIRDLYTYGLKRKKGNMHMKKIVKKVAKTIVRNWNEANELMAKSSVYSL